MLLEKLSCSHSTEIPHILWNPMVQNRLRKSPTLVPTWRQINHDRITAQLQTLRPSPYISVHKHEWSHQHDTRAWPNAWFSHFPFNKRVLYSFRDIKNSRNHVLMKHDWPQTSIRINSNPVLRCAVLAFKMPSPRHTSNKSELSSRLLSQYTPAEIT